MGTETAVVEGGQLVQGVCKPKRKPITSCEGGHVRDSRGTLFPALPAFVAVVLTAWTLFSVGVGPLELQNQGLSLSGGG